MVRLAFILTALAAPLSAQSLDGRYYWPDLNPAQACDPQAYSDGAITIAGDQIAFVESRCNLTNPVSVRGMDGTYLYDAKCTGEGEDWTERMMVYPTFDGVAVLSRGWARTYIRCK